MRREEARERREGEMEGDKYIKQFTHKIITQRHRWEREHKLNSTSGKRHETAKSKSITEKNQGSCCSPRVPLSNSETHQEDEKDSVQLHQSPINA